MIIQAIETEEYRDYMDFYNRNSEKVKAVFPQLNDKMLEAFDFPKGIECDEDFIVAVLDADKDNFYSVNYGDSDDGYFFVSKLDFDYLRLAVNMANKVDLKETRT